MSGYSGLRTQIESLFDFLNVSIWDLDTINILRVNNIKNYVSKNSDNYDNYEKDLISVLQKYLNNEKLDQVDFSANIVPGTIGSFLFGCILANSQEVLNSLFASKEEKIPGSCTSLCAGSLGNISECKDAVVLLYTPKYEIKELSSPDQKLSQIIYIYIEDVSNFNGFNRTLIENLKGQYGANALVRLFIKKNGQYYSYPPLLLKSKTNSLGLSTELDNFNSSEVKYVALDDLDNLGKDSGDIITSNMLPGIVTGIFTLIIIGLAFKVSK